MKIDISDDMVYNIVVGELQDIVRMTLDNPYELYHDEDKAYALVDSVLSVLEYYMSHTDFVLFHNSLPDYNYGPREITVNDITENEDGSANISIDIPKRDIPAFVNEGVKYVLMKSVFDNPSDDELVQWIERGKQEERVDKRVEQLLRDFDEA